jgi:hypothetical protein
MKISTLYIGVSLTLNVVLLAVLARSALENAPSPMPASQPSAAKATPAPGAPADVWTEIQGGDLAAQAAKLRAEGFPPATIRAIMLAQVRAQFADRRKALGAAAAARPYWDGASDPQQTAAEAALRREEAQAIKAVLGDDPENGYAARLRRSLPDLPAEKVALLAQIRERFDERRSDLHPVVGGRSTPADEEKLAALEKAQLAEIAAALTPQELEDYELRESSTASQLRYRLAGFDATEQEYRSLFKLQSDFDSRFSNRGFGGDSAEQQRARREAQAQLKAQTEATLGAERYAAYERANDYGYRQTTQIVARLNLPPETANEIYALQQSTQQQAAALRASIMPAPASDPKARAAQAAEYAARAKAIVAEAEAQISAKLGPTGFEVYKSSNTWLNNLTSPRIMTSTSGGTATGTTTFRPAGP